MTLKDVYDFIHPFIGSEYAEREATLIVHMSECDIEIKKQEQMVNGEKTCLITPNFYGVKKEKQECGGK